MRPTCYSLCIDTEKFVAVSFEELPWGGKDVTEQLLAPEFCWEIWQLGAISPGRVQP